MAYDATNPSNVVEMESAKEETGTYTVNATAVDVVGSVDPAAATSPAATANVTSGPGSIVPAEFRGTCDVVFDTLGKVGGGGGPEEVADAAAAEGAWLRYGEGEAVTHALMGMVERGGYGGVGVTRAGFSLGCYLLASRKPGVAFAAPKYCTVQQFIESGYTASRKVQTLSSIKHSFYYRLLAVLLAVNVFFGLVSLLYWVVAPASFITLVVGCYLFYFHFQYPFLTKNNTEFANSILAFAILGPFFLMAGFIMMAFLGDRNINGNTEDDYVRIWAFIYGFIALFQIVYLVLSVIYIIRVLRALNRLSGTEMIQLPEIEKYIQNPNQGGNSLAIFVVGMVFDIATGVMLIAFTIWGACSSGSRLLVAILIWGLEMPLSIVAMGLLSEAVRRRYPPNRTFITVFALVVSVLEVLASVYEGVPFLIFYDWDYD
ncbi:hypothetical protein Pelo_12626 [Pelomyxa schiedti]|nr:hypothetical protein Pelo_12626 [Pelomyxa schiedti]